jgi:hypothetical protein
MGDNLLSCAPRGSRNRYIQHTSALGITISLEHQKVRVVVLALPTINHQPSIGCMHYWRPKTPRNNERLIAMRPSTILEENRHIQDESVKPIFPLPNLFPQEMSHTS